MNRTWDVSESERVFSAHEGITRHITSARRLVPDVSSMVRLAVIVGMTAAGVTANDLPIMLNRGGGTSELCVVVERSKIPVRRSPSRERRPGVDFVRARSPQQLASGFRGIFRPARDIDDSSEDGFVFR